MYPYRPKLLLTLLILACLGSTAFAQSAEEGGFFGGDKGKSVQVFPNPAVEYVNIRFETQKVDDVKLTLHNLIGNEMNVESEKVNDYEVRIRVKDLATGYYLIAVQGKESKTRSTYKFLKR